MYHASLGKRGLPQKEESGFLIITEFVSLSYQLRSVKLAFENSVSANFNTALQSQRGGKTLC